MTVSANNGPNKLSGRKQISYKIAPLLILLLIILLINIFSGDEPSTTTAEAPGMHVTAQPAATSRPVILQATVLPSPTPTTTPRPTVSANAAIQLQGPPAESSLLLNGRLAVYWQFSEPLQPGQQFVLTLRQNEQSFRVGTVNQANIGDGYQILLDLAGTEVVAGTAVWQVHLEWIDDQQPLLSSETRTLTLLPN